MSEKFENLASKIFEDKSVKFSDQNLKSLSTLLEPFKERLKDFEKKVEENYSTERAERGSLRGELSKLTELNIRMSSEAHNLTKALKGDNKTMGNWGEMILENILERSGLRKGVEFIIQGIDMGLKNDQGQQIRPDVIVNLPDSKHIIVDAKVSLVAYEKMVNASTEEDRSVFLKEHLTSIYNHIKNLSDKTYYTSPELSSPEFVLIFMPIEPSFGIASAGIATSRFSLHFANRTSELTSPTWDADETFPSVKTLAPALTILLDRNAAIEFCSIFTLFSIERNCRMSFINPPAFHQLK